MKLINVMLVRTCDFSISKTPGARLLSVSEAETFIKEKKLGPLEGFRSKRGFLFAGTIVLTDDYKLNFDFESADDDSLEELNYEKKMLLVFVLNVLEISLFIKQAIYVRILSEKINLAFPQWIDYTSTNYFH